jgi:hypothetical protein
VHPAYARGKADLSAKQGAKAAAELRNLFANRGIVGADFAG